MSNLEETKEFLEKECIENCGHNSNENCICTLALCFKEIEKSQEQEKVLEIIKERIDIDLCIILSFDTFEEYNRISNSFKTKDSPRVLTKEEFELLKQYFEKNIQK